MKLTPSVQKFILHWSGIASTWGFNRTVAQIHALLLASPDPLTADEIKAILQVARSNVSNSLRVLENLGLIHTISIMGDRRKHFEALKDIKQMFKRVMGVRRRKEAEYTLKSLNDCATTASRDADRPMQKQLNELTSVFGKLDSLYGKLIDDI